MYFYLQLKQFVACIFIVLIQTIVFLLHSKSNIAAQQGTYTSYEINTAKVSIKRSSYTVRVYSFLVHLVFWSLLLVVAYFICSLLRMSNKYAQF